VFDKKESAGKRPDFVSRDGVMVWKNLDKNGKEYLSVRIPLLNISCNCFALDQEDQQEGQQIEVEEEKVD